MPFDPTKIRRRSDEEQPKKDTILRGPRPRDFEPSRGFDPSAIRRRQPENTGLGAAAGSLLATIPELVGTGKVKAAALAALPRTLKTKGQRLANVALMEGRIAAGAAAGDVAETGVLAASRGNLPLSIEAFRQSGRLLEQAGKSALDEAGLSFLFGVPLRGAVGLRNKLMFRPEAMQSPHVNLVYRVFGEKMEQAGLPPLTLAAGTKSATLDTLDNVARAGIGGAGTMSRYDDMAIQASNELLTLASRGVSPDRPINELTQELFDVIMHQEEIADLPAIVMRNTISEQAGGLGLRASTDDTIELLDFIQRNADDIDAIGGFGRRISGVSGASTLMNIAQEPSVADLFQIRSFAKAMQRSLQADPVTASNPQVGMMKKIIVFSDKALKNTLKDADAQHGTEMFKMLNRSDSDFGKHYARFHGDLITKIKRAINLNKNGNPVGVADRILLGEQKNNLGFIRAAKDAWPAEHWPKVQRAVIDRMRDKITDKKTGQISGEKMREFFADAEQFGNVKRLGKEAREALFGKELAGSLKDFAEALAFAQTKNPTSVGTVGTSLAQGGAVLGAAGATLLGEPMSALGIVSVVTGIPWLFAKLGTSTVFVKAATKGLRMSPKNPAWGPLYGRLISMIQVAQEQERRENRPPIPVQARGGSALVNDALKRPAVTQ